MFFFAVAAAVVVGIVVGVVGVVATNLFLGPRLFAVVTAVAAAVVC